MELSEAKERLKALVYYCYNNKECWDSEFCSDCYIEVEDNKAFEVILNYMDNSISKDEVRKLLSVIETDEEIAMSNEDEKIVNELKYLKGKLQELLGEE